ALGSRPNDFAIPGLAQHALSLYSAGDAERVWAAVNKALDEAAAATDPERRRRHRSRAGRRTGRDTARGGQPPRPGARAARRAACRGRPHYPGRLLAAA